MKIYGMKTPELTISQFRKICRYYLISENLRYIFLYYILYFTVIMLQEMRMEVVENNCFNSKFLQIIIGRRSLKLHTTLTN